VTCIPIQRTLGCVAMVTVTHISLGCDGYVYIYSEISRMCCCDVHTSRCMHMNMGRLPLVGSLKLQVSFAESSHFYRALLQKRTIILRRLLIVATSYDSDVCSYSMCRDGGGDVRIYRM